MKTLWSKRTITSKRASIVNNNDIKFKVYNPLVFWNFNKNWKSKRQYIYYRFILKFQKTKGAYEEIYISLELSKITILLCIVLYLKSMLISNIFNH